MSVITPTITTADPHEYRNQMELIASYADGVHLDFADGDFAPSKLLSIDQAWRDDRLITHAHIMYRNPLAVIDAIRKLDADLVILHVESENVKQSLEELLEQGVRTGIAILPSTDVQKISELKLNNLFDHLLVFGGQLGYQGGTADMKQLEKVKRLKQLYPDCELAWDGGVTDQTAAQIASSGVSILNVGGFLKQAEDAKKAYAQLVTLVQSY